MRRVAPLLELLDEDEVERVQFELAYQDPTGGGLALDYGAAGALPLRNALGLMDRLVERREDIRKFMIRLHGGKV